MAEYIIQDSTLQGIADAIRSKTGDTAPIQTDAFAEAIEGIQAGGGDASVVDGLIDGSVTEVSSNATSIRQYAFYTCTSLATVNLPKATNGADYAFTGCRKLKTVNLPLAVNLLNNMYENCESLVTVNFPKVEYVYGYGFRGCRSLEVADFSVVKKFFTSAFSNCYRLNTLILRCEAMCEVSGANVFSNCYHMLGTANSTYNPNGLHDGYVYVPSALKSSYEANSEWSSSTLQFRALENYTVDGTITGELDPNKI